MAVVAYGEPARGRTPDPTPAHGRILDLARRAWCTVGGVHASLVKAVRMKNEFFVRVFRI